MVGPARGVRLAEPVHDVGPVGRVVVLQRSEQADARPGTVEVSNPDQDVDDGLGCEVGHRSATHVVNAAGDPCSDGRVEQ